MAFPVGSSGILSTLDPDLIEDGRADIYKWSETRRSKRKGFKGKLYQFKKLFIDKSILRTFVYNLTVILFLQMVLAALGTFMCQKLRLDFDVHMSIFVSPIVFPLAFSINADFQRRERVLEDLAQFKGALLILFFCHRDWLHSAGLPKEFLKTVNNKLKGLVLNIKEFLLTEKHIRRNFILSVIYEDLSDISQLNDKMRVSSLPHNEPLITRLIHYHNLMCHAFERLRVIREYRSPRTIRSFTKVFIFLMPIVLSPYYVHMGIKSGNTWSPYYIAVLTSFIFGTLQGVQDVLDDPFDGISEDDINLGPLEDWTCQSLLTDRTITVGRFTVTTKGQEGRKMELSDIDEDEGRSPMPSHPVKVPHKRKSILRKPSFRKEEHCENFAQAHRTAPLYPAAASRIEDLTRRGLTGSTTILPGMKLKRSNSDTLMANASSASLDQEFRRAQEADESGRDSKRVTFLTESRDLYDGDDESEHGNSVFVSTRSLSDPPKYSRPTWRSDESEPLILLDSRSGSSDMGTSALNTPDRERKNLGLDFYEGLNKSPGTSLVDARKVKKHSNPPLANLFSVNSVESADCADGPVPPKPSQPISMPSSLQNLFGSPQNQKLEKPPSGSKSFSSERPRPFALPMSPLAREESSSSSRSFPAPRVSRSAPCSPEQERRNSFRQISDPVTPSHENAAVLSSKPRTRQRKTSANIPLSKNSGDSPSGNSRFAVDTTSRTPTVQEAESLLSPSRRKSSSGSSRLLVSPDPQAPAVNNSAQVAQAPLADENFSIETPAPSKPVNTPISRFNVAKRSNSVINSEREDKPLVSSNIPNYGLTDSSPPPSRFKVNSPRKISQETKQQSEDEEEPDSFQLLTVDGGSTEVFI